MMRKMKFSLFFMTDWLTIIGVLEYFAKDEMSWIVNDRRNPLFIAAEFRNKNLWSHLSIWNSLYWRPSCTSKKSSTKLLKIGEHMLTVWKISYSELILACSRISIR